MVQVDLSLSGLVGLVLGTEPLCVMLHKKVLVTTTCAVAAGAFVAGAVAVFVMLPTVAVVVYDDVPVHVVDELIGMVVRGEAQTKLGWATGAPAPRVIVHAIVYGDGNTTGTLPVLVNL